MIGVSAPIERLMGLVANGGVRRMTDRQLAAVSLALLHVESDLVAAMNVPGDRDTGALVRAWMALEEERHPIRQEIRRRLREWKPEGVA